MTPAAVVSQPSSHSAYRHEALLYRGLEEFTASVGAFVAAGVDAGEATMVMVGGDKIELLRDELGADADAVSFVDMDEVGKNPARIIPAWLDFMERAGDGRIRGVGEPIGPHRTPAELAECRRHEELLNVAVPPDAPFWLLCPYDTTSLPQEVLDDVARTHPVVARDGKREISDAFLGVAAHFDDPLSEPPAPIDEIAFDGGNLPYIRQVVGDRARSAGLGRDAAGDLVLAMNEVATNSLRHGGGRGVLRLWRDDDAIVCEIRDGGYIAEPLAGRRRPPAEYRGGRGLWMVHQLCDLTELRTSPSGTVIRLHRGAA